MTQCFVLHLFIRLIFGEFKLRLTCSFGRPDLCEQTSVWRDTPSPVPPGVRNQPTLALSAAGKVKEQQIHLSFYFTAGWHTF